MQLKYVYCLFTDFVVSPFTCETKVIYKLNILKTRIFIFSIINRLPDPH